MELYRTRLYSIYAGMKQRCYNPKSSHFEYYGEKGVKICDEWLNGTDGLQNFMEWALAHGYNEELTIDRIDPAGDYSPDNCRWLTVQENAGRANRGRGVHLRRWDLLALSDTELTF